VIHYPESPVLERRDLGVTAGGRLLAAGQYAIEGPTCLLSWLAADPGEPGALAEWIDALEDLARDRGCTAVVQTRNELGIGWFGTPLRWDHVIRGLREAGHEPGERWLIMTADAGAAPPPAAPPYRTLRVEREARPDALEWSTHAWVGDVPAADVTVWGPPVAFRDCPGYASWTTLEAVDVEEPFQRQGLARYLLTSEMARLADRGAGHVLLFTETGNLPARRLFESLGFTAGPECWCLGRSLEHPAPGAGL
jgi:GNAT superfamily N-acetyltransferase